MAPILVPTDGSPAAETAIAQAVPIAENLNSTVHGLFAVYLPIDADYNLAVEHTNILAEEEKRGQDALDRIERLCDERGVHFVRHLQDGDPAETIISVAKTIEADVIVMGTQGASGLHRPLLGSTTIDVLLAGTHPILAVPEGVQMTTEENNKILIGTDASENANQAERMALSWAEAFDAPIHALYVIEENLADDKELKAELESEGQEVLADLAARAEEIGIESTTSVEIGVPHEELCKKAEETNAQIITLGAHGRSGIEPTYLGSVAERTLRTADRPVLVV